MSDFDLNNVVCAYKGAIKDASACGEAVVAGIEDVAILFSRAHVTGYTYATPTVEGGAVIGQISKVITAVQFGFTKSGSILVGTNNDKEGGGMYENNAHKHVLNFKAKNPGAVVTDRIAKMCKTPGGVVAVVKTKAGSENYRILGRVGGLMVATATNEFHNQDTLGGFQVNGEAAATAFPDYLGVWSGTVPDQTWDETLSAELFNSLLRKQWFDIANIVAGTVTTIQMDTTTVGNAEVGEKVEFRNIVGTISTALNGLSFAISKIVNETTFEIALDTSALAYSSGGEAR
ncbi:MAG: hypothetical protein ACRCXN_13070 [Bacteroidales bacterium]